MKAFTRRWFLGSLAAAPAAAAEIGKPIAPPEVTPQWPIREYAVPIPIDRTPGDLWTNPHGIIAERE